MVIVWFVIIIKYAAPMGQIFLQGRPDWLRLSVYLSFILLGAGYVYKLIHLILYSMDGIGIHGFILAYLILKNIG